jgi:D-sedoheptulose 7-phosphate isomerase
VSLHSEADVRAALAARERLFAEAAAAAPAVLEAARVLVGSLRPGGTVWACGNGGSATQAQHLVAELVGRFRRERGALRAFCLSDNTATVTAVANDYDFADVFARQVRGLSRAGDCLVALSTSGNSENVVRACAAAREVGVPVIALTGAGGGRVAAVSDVVIRVPAPDTPRVQEGHLVVIHLLCEIVEGALAEETGGSPAAGR